MVWSRSDFFMYLKKKGPIYIFLHLGLWLSSYGTDPTSGVQMNFNSMSQIYILSIHNGVCTKIYNKIYKSTATPPIDVASPQNYLTIVYSVILFYELRAGTTLRFISEIMYIPPPTKEAVYFTQTPKWTILFTRLNERIFTFIDTYFKTMNKINMYDCTNHN